MPQKIRTTLLNDWHGSHRANMAAFAGYEMPLWYPAGAKEEHLAVLTRAGLFDTSHMAGILVTGPDAFAFLQFLFTKDLSRCMGLKKLPLTPGRSVYGAFLNEKGHVVDDSIIFQLDETTFMPFVNAGMGPAVVNHMAAYVRNRDVVLTDLTGRLGKIDIQGPLSAKIMKKILSDPDKTLGNLIYFKFKGHFDPDTSSPEPVVLSDNTPVMLSRTGYTGEFGFEIFMVPDRLASTWELILEAGKPFGLIPCGLAARDSLRAGAVLPLSHQDIGNWPYINHPWPFALPLDDTGAGFTKDFLGARALSRMEKPEYTYPFVGFDLRKVPGDGQALVFPDNGDGSEPIGTVLTCVTDMGIGWREDRILSVASSDKPDNFSPGGLACGFVKVNTPLGQGERLRLSSGRRQIRVMVTHDIRPDRTARKPMKAML